MVFVRRGNKWFKCDDEDVSVVHKSDFETIGACFVGYVRSAALSSDTKGVRRSSPASQFSIF